MNNIVSNDPAIFKQLVESAEEFGVFQQFVESADVLFFAVDEHMRYIYINPFFEKTHNLTLQDAVGKHFKDVIGEEGFQNNLKRYNRALQGEVIKYESCFPKRDGGMHHYHAIYTPILQQGSVIGFTGVVRDVTAEKKLEIISTTDQLTGLFNRHKLEETFQYEFNRSNRLAHTFGVILLDIDNFKIINDNYGHQVGDQVLQSMGDILKTRVRKSDTVGRWGGEEFLIICPNANRTGLTNLAETLRNAIESFDFPKVSSITSSFGVTCVTTDDDSISLIARVDEALYKAKNQGRNRVEFL